MCLDPGTLAALQLATAATAAVAAYQGQSSMADAQAKGNEIQTKQFLLEADQSRMDAERQRSEQYQAAAAETNRYAAEARANLASYDALLGEGAAGNTAGRKLATVGVQNGENLSTLASNATRVQAEIGMGERSSLNATNQKLASLRPVERPSLAGTALTIAGAGLKYGQQMDSINNPKSPFKVT